MSERSVKLDYCGLVDNLGQPISTSNPLPVAVQNNLNVSIIGVTNVVSTVNSSITPLAGGGVFTGTSEDVLGYKGITVLVFTDQDSAVDGLKIQFSSDGTNWDESEEHTISANTTHVTSSVRVARYFRIVYTNGAVAQSIFRLQTIFNINDGVRLESLDGDIQDNHIVQTVRSIMAAKKPNGSYTNIDATAGGNLKVAIEEFDASLPAGTNNIGDVDVLTLPKSIQGPSNPSIDSYTSDDVNLAANTANQSVIAAPGANKQIWVYGLVGTVDVAGSISIQDEDDTAHSGVMPVAATGGFVMNPSGNFSMPWIKVATNKALEIDTVTCTFDGIITYAIVSV